MAYEERTAGGLMTTEPIVLRPDATVADALARVRKPDLSPALAAQVYVCRPPDETPTGKYLGTVHFQRLLRDPPFTLVGSIVDSDLQPLAPDTPLPAVTSYLADVQHGLGARGGRERVAARRGDRRRRTGPPAARRTGARPTSTASEEDRPMAGEDTPAGRVERAPAGHRAPPPRPGSTSRRRRGAGCCRSTTRRRSAGSPSGSPASWAPGGSSSG